MCTSGCGFITATFLSRWNSASLSATGWLFQNTSPSRLTEISMFSGRVWRAMLVSLGRVIAIDCVTTGMVIRKMISSTSITSTSGVVLIVLVTSSSSPPEPMFMAMAFAPGGLAQRADLAPISTPCTSAAKPRTASSVTLLRRTSQL